MSALKDAALENMPDISVTLETSQFEMSPLNACARKNMEDMSSTLDTSHFEMSPLKDVEPRNMALILVTLDTSHFEMSPSKRSAPISMALISVTFDTSHSPIGPCGPAVQSEDNLRHSSMALLSSDLDGGENAEVNFISFSLEHIACDGDSAKARPNPD